MLTNGFESIDLFPSIQSFGVCKVSVPGKRQLVLHTNSVLREFGSGFSVRFNEQSQVCVRKMPTIALDWQSEYELVHVQTCGTSNLLDCCVCTACKVWCDAAAVHWQKTIYVKRTLNWANDQCGGRFAEHEARERERTSSIWLRGASTFTYVFRARRKKCEKKINDNNAEVIIRREWSSSSNNNNGDGRKSKTKQTDDDDGSDEEAEEDENDDVEEEAINSFNEC